MKEFKVRRSGNSDVVTLPPEVKERLNIKRGDSIIYVLNDRGETVIKKAPSNMDDVIEEAINRHEDAIRDLVDL